MTLFRTFLTFRPVSPNVEDVTMMRLAEASSMIHRGMGREFPEVQSHRTLLQASQTVRTELLSRCQEILPPDLLPLVAHAMTFPDAALHRDTAAQQLGISRRTLHRRLIEAGCPAPRRFLLTLRLLIAAGLLDHGIPSLDRIAWHLSFSDGAALAKALRRLTGVTVHSLRNTGALSHCLTRLHSCPDTSLDASTSPAPHDSPTRPPHHRRREWPRLGPLPAVPRPG